MKYFIVLLMSLLMLSCNIDKDSKRFESNVIEQVQTLGLQEEVEHDKEGIIQGILIDGMKKKQMGGNILDYMHETVVIVHGPKQVSTVHKLVAYQAINEHLNMAPPYEEGGVPIFDLFSGEQNGFLIYNIEYPYQEGVDSSGEPILALAGIKFLVNGNEIIAIR